MPTEPEVISGVIVDVVFQNEDSGWTVARLERDDALLGGRVTIVGTLPGLRPGESVRVTGAWKEHRSFGRQLEVSSCSFARPAGRRGILAYLASGMLKGVGPALAERIVERFGEATLEVLDSSPRRLKEVSGIGPKRMAAIEEAWARQRGVRELMLFLAEHGVAPSLAGRIYRALGQGALQAVRADPYRLAERVSGIGFRTADAMARKLGADIASPHRLRGALLHCLREHVEAGNVYCPRVELLGKATALLGEPAPEGVALERELQELGNGSAVFLETLPDEAEPAVFLPELRAAEIGIADSLRRLLGVSRPELTRGPQGIELSPEQERAIDLAARSGVLIVTGGPGTGKTTLVRALIESLGRAAEHVLLAAPTGRASKRLEEASGMEAKTIHRLLEYSPADGSFGRNERNPLEAELLVVDECSMVDVSLMHSLLLAVPSGCRVVLVGDADQLPSVGPGAVLQDLIGSGALPSIVLTTVFRQAARSDIVLQAHRIRQGLLPESREEGSDFFMVRKEDPEEIVSTIKKLLQERIPARFGFDPLRDVQVLAPMHRGPVGTARLNTELQELLNPRGVAARAGGRTMRIGDKVMQLRNDYEKGVYNGDVGVVRSASAEDGSIEVDFDGVRSSYDAEDIDDLTLAYASTIHKAQGSEYPAVVIALHPQHYVLLQRNLVYTAVTRGKRLVVIVGSPRAMAVAVRNDRSGRRHTALRSRLSSPPWPAPAPL